MSDAFNSVIIGKMTAIEAASKYSVNLNSLKVRIVKWKKENPNTPIPLA